MMKLGGGSFSLQTKILYRSTNIQTTSVTHLGTQSDQKFIFEADLALVGSLWSLEEFITFETPVSQSA